MERVLAYAISAGITGFGMWLLIAGLSSDAPALWACAALPPFAIGLLSAFGDCQIARTSLIFEGYQSVQRIFLGITFLAVRGLPFRLMIALDWFTSVGGLFHMHDAQQTVARQDETAAQLSEWLTSPGLEAPR